MQPDPKKLGEELVEGRNLFDQTAPLTDAQRKRLDAIDDDLEAEVERERDAASADGKTVPPLDDREVSP